MQKSRRRASAQIYLGTSGQRRERPAHLVGAGCHGITRANVISAEAQAQYRVQTLSAFDSDKDFPRCLDWRVPD